jgi:hypothetical protein
LHSGGYLRLWDKLWGVRRTDLMDTADWAHREMVRRLRELTPEQRWRMVFDRMEMGRHIDDLAMARVGRPPRVRGL